MLATFALLALATGALPPIDSGTSLLVVAPHPDDEALCCAGAMRRVLEAGGRVSIIWMTSGDGSELAMLIVEKSLLKPRDKVRDLATKRMQEARAATALLGVDQARQFFLGYPDGGLTRLMTTNLKTPWPAKFTGETRVPYPDAAFPGHPYTGESLQRDFSAVLDRVQPTLILAPSPKDTHPDHAATGLATIHVLTARKQLTSARYWVVHDGEGWPKPRGYVPGIPLQSPRPGLEPFPLTDMEVDSKLQAVNTYHTQMQLMAPFLLAFVRTTELYSLQPEP